MKSAVKHVDAFISPDRFTAARHREEGLDLPTVHIPHFVPLPDAATVPAADGIEARRTLFGDRLETPYFLFVGRLEKLKGLQTLIPLFARYRKARLLVAGTGTFERDLRGLAAGCDTIEFLGHQTGAALELLYRHAVALLALSLSYEVSPPLVIMEAFRHGTPAIVRRLGSMPEIIDDSGGGLLYSTDDELLAALDTLLDDPAYRDALGQKGSAALRERWTPDAYLEKYLGLIEELSARKRAVQNA
jgi:glycosyltransferase involved in cell wall biosynthesis